MALTQSGGSTRVVCFVGKMMKNRRIIVESFQVERMNCLLFGILFKFYEMNFWVLFIVDTSEIDCFMVQFILVRDFGGCRTILLERALGASKIHQQRTKVQCVFRSKMSFLKLQFSV